MGLKTNNNFINIQTIKKKMKYVYHYTTSFKWFFIKNIFKKLLPRTPYASDVEFTKRTQQIANKKRYICAMETIQNWEDYGALNWIKYKIANKSKNLILLKIPLEGQEGFVREHKYFSPKWSQKHLGFDIWQRFYYDIKILTLDPKRAKEEEIKEITPNEINARQRLLKDHYNDITSLNEYKKGQYKLPEYWLANPIPISQIEVVKE